jgi:lipoprotein NlpD
MKKVTIFFGLLMGATYILSACGGLPSNAPIDDRTNPIKSKNQTTKSEAEKAEGESVIIDKPGFYTVKKGDTLSRISQQFNQRLSDLVDWNKLSDPNAIKAGQVLRIEPEEGVSVAPADLNAGIEVKPLNANSAPVPAQPPVNKKGPLGNKTVYSDQAMADLQRGEPVSTAASTSSSTPSNTAPNTASTSVPSNAPTSSASNSPTTASPSKFIWPTNGSVIKNFEANKKGIDISGQAGQSVVAVGDGSVLYANNMRGYGNLVIIDHADGIVSAYAHNKSLMVKEGQSVTKGQQIAEMGNTDSDNVKLHFEMRQLGKPVDPASLLPAR